MVESFAPPESANTEVSATPKAHPHFPEERSHSWCLEHSVSQQRGFTKSHWILPGRRGGRGGGGREVILGKVRQNQAVPEPCQHYLDLHVLNTRRFLRKFF